MLYNLKNVVIGTIGVINIAGWCVDSKLSVGNVEAVTFASKMCKGAGGMVVYVCDGFESIAIEVEVNTTVADLRRKFLERKFMVYFHFEFQGENLDKHSSELLSDINISAECVVDVVLPQADWLMPIFFEQGKKNNWQIQNADVELIEEKEPGKEWIWSVSGDVREIYRDVTFEVSNWSINGARRSVGDGVQPFKGNGELRFFDCEQSGGWNAVTLRSYERNPFPQLVVAKVYGADAKK